MFFLLDLESSPNGGGEDLENEKQKKRETGRGSLDYKEWEMTFVRMGVGRYGVGGMDIR